jgi:hypothetical protein
MAGRTAVRTGHDEFCNLKKGEDVVVILVIHQIRPPTHLTQNTTHNRHGRSHGSAYRPPRTSPHIPAAHAAHQPQAPRALLPPMTFMVSTLLIRTG